MDASILLTRLTLTATFRFISAWYTTNAAAMSANLAALVMAQVASTDPLHHSPPQKRKRLGDISPSDLRHKRPSLDDPDPEDEYGDSVDTAQAAAAGVNVSDFNALQQAAAGTDHNDVTDPANASTTAAAALVYPTISAPQPTEENFAAQLGVQVQQDELQEQPPPPPPQHHHHHHEMSPYPHETSHDGYSDHQSLSNGHHVNDIMQQDMPGARYGNHTATKPAVGSEEWHQMRKDSHKEGECSRILDKQHFSRTTDLETGHPHRSHGLKGDYPKAITQLAYLNL